MYTFYYIIFFSQRSSFHMANDWFFNNNAKFYWPPLGKYYMFLKSIFSLPSSSSSLPIKKTEMFDHKIFTRRHRRLAIVFFYMNCTQISTPNNLSRIAFYIPTHSAAYGRLNAPHKYDLCFSCFTFFTHKNGSLYVHILIFYRSELLCFLINLFVYFYSYAFFLCKIFIVPPKIHHISSGPSLQAKKGSTVRIECSASGNPSPNVTWTRKNNVMPNGKCFAYYPFFFYMFSARSLSGTIIIGKAFNLFSIDKTIIFFLNNHNLYPFRRHQTIVDQPYDWEHGPAQGWPVHLYGQQWSRTGGCHSSQCACSL